MTSSYSKTSVFWSVHNKTISRRFKRLPEPCFFGVWKRRLRVNGGLKRRKNSVFKNVGILVDARGRWAEQSFNRRLSWSFATVKGLSQSSSCRQGSASKAGSFFVKLRETAVSEVTVGKTANESAPFSLLKCLTYDTCGCFWKFRDATLTK